MWMFQKRNSANIFILDYLFQIITNSPIQILADHCKKRFYCVFLHAWNTQSQASSSVFFVPSVVGTLELNTSSPTNNSIVLTWEMVEHAVLYTLSLSEEGSSIMVQVNTTNTTMTFMDLEPGTTYCISANAWGSDQLPSGDAFVCQITRKAQVLGVLIYVTIW